METTIKFYNGFFILKPLPEPVRQWRISEQFVIESSCWFARYHIGAFINFTTVIISSVRHRRTQVRRKAALSLSFFLRGREGLLHRSADWRILSRSPSAV